MTRSFLGALAELLRRRPPAPPAVQSRIRWIYYDD